MTDFTWECAAKGGFVAVEHQKIFATECQCCDSHKNVNIEKKTSSCRFCGVNFTSGEDKPQLKIYFRRREELKVQG